MMTTLKVSGWDMVGNTIMVRCDLSRPESNISVDYACCGEWQPTQFRSSDAGGTIVGLQRFARLIAAEACEMSSVDCDIEIIEGKQNDD